MLETHCIFLPLLVGNFDWVGNAFTQNAGAGLVINQADAGNSTSIIKQLKAVFERDWYSHYAKSLQPTKIPNCFNHKLNKATSNKTAMSNVNQKDYFTVQYGNEELRWGVALFHIYRQKT